MNVFDILGPVMIGPSSSHTAGAARIGRITRTLLGAPAVKADILLHGSFAKTYKGHGTDKALIAGIMGMATDDVRIRQAPELAKEIDEFQSALFKLPAFKTLETMRRFCRYAQPTNEATEFNLYSETDHLYIWVRLITRFRDYNVYVHYYDKNYQ